MESTRPALAAERLRSRARDAARTVLLADDDEDFRSALAELLAEDGHQVISVPSGEASLAVLDDAARGRRRAPDLLILDLLMPKMSGVEVLRTLRASKRWSRLPIVIVTGANDPMLRVRLDMPIVFKPDIDDVLAAVRAQLGQHRSARAERLTPAALEL
jgi:DNA-binding response OmpR family regulator